MLKSTLTILAVPISLTAQINNPAQWIHGLSSSKTGNNLLYSETDIQGNIWVIGEMGNNTNPYQNGMVWVGPDTVKVAPDKKGHSEIFMEKLDPNGKLLFLKKLDVNIVGFWVRGFDVHDDGGAALLFQIGADNTVNGKVYKSGDHVIVNYTPDGEIRWSKMIRGATYMVQRSQLLSIDDQDRVLVSGIILPSTHPASGTVQFDQDSTIASQLKPQVFVSRYGAMDGSSTIRAYQASQEIEIVDVFKGSNGNFWCSAHMPNATTITVDTVTLNLTRTYQNVLLEFNENLRVKAITSPYSDAFVDAMVPLPGGSVQVLSFVGSSDKSTTENRTGKIISFANSTYSYNRLLYKLNPEGLTEWHYEFNGSFWRSLDVDLFGNALVTSGQNIFDQAMAYFDHKGKLKEFGKINSQYNRWVHNGTFDSKGDMHILARANYAVWVKGDTAQLDNDYGFFVLKICGDHREYIQTVNLSGKDSVVFHGTTYKQSGQYTIIKFINRCEDSVFNLNVVINTSGIGTSGESTAEGLIAYPNPFWNDLIIKQTHANHKFLEVYTYSGLLMLRQELAIQDHVIKTQDWFPGLYVVRILNSDGRINGSQLLLKNQSNF